MVKTKKLILQEFKKLLSKYSLDKITVSQITDKCNIKRQTFYYHFHDIYDLLTLIFLNEEIPELDEVQNVNDTLVYIYKYYLKNNLIMFEFLHIISILLL